LAALTGIRSAGSRRGLGIDDTVGRAAEATSGKAGDGRHCSGLSGRRFAANAGLREYGRAYGVYS